MVCTPCAMAMLPGCSLRSATLYWDCCASRPSPRLSLRCGPTPGAPLRPSYACSVSTSPDNGNTADDRTIRSSYDVTTMVPCKYRWTVQWQWKVPVCVKVRLKGWLGLITLESHVTAEPASPVEVWGVPVALVHTTVVPIFVVIIAGVNAKPL